MYDKISDVNGCDQCRRLQGRCHVADVNVTAARNMLHRYQGRRGPKPALLIEYGNALKRAAQFADDERGLLESHQLECPEYKPHRISVPSPILAKVAVQPFGPRLHKRSGLLVDEGLLADIAPVKVSSAAVETRRRSGARPKDDPTRVANGSCHTEDCGKPVTGERLYCGRCMSRRSH